MHRNAETEDAAAAIAVGAERSEYSTEVMVHHIASSF